MSDSFSVNLQILSSFLWDLFKNIWQSFCACVGFHVSTRFVIAVGSGRGDGAANFAELHSDFSEPGKHVWTFDMAEVLHVHVKVCAWHVSVDKYRVARKATTRLFRSCDDL